MTLIYSFNISVIAVRTLEKKMWQCSTQNCYGWETKS